jgi:hypothetical protein
MGHGNYSHAAHAALLADRSHLSANEVFKQRGCHPLMNPHGLGVRESRDSAEHPSALGIAFALDVTGSMGDIPKLLAQRDLPQFMGLLGACGVPDPQVLFMAIGDATSDHAPLQAAVAAPARRATSWPSICWPGTPTWTAGSSAAAAATSS